RNSRAPTADGHLGRAGYRLLFHRVLVEKSLTPYSKRDASRSTTGEPHAGRPRPLRRLAASRLLSAAWQQRAFGVEQRGPVHRRRVGDFQADQFLRDVGVRRTGAVPAVVAARPAGGTGGGSLQPQVPAD